MKKIKYLTYSITATLTLMITSFLLVFVYQGNLPSANLRDSQAIDFGFKDYDLGESHSAIIDFDDNIWIWGSNQFGQLGIDQPLNQSFNPLQVLHENGLKWDSISLGFLHSGAIDSNGDLWTWGSNEFGQLGTGSLTVGENQFSPVRIIHPSGIGWEKLSLGFTHSLAIDTNGDIWAWGRNDRGQLGLGDEFINSIYAEPRLVADNGIDWVHIETGASFSAAIDSNGDLYTWGRNDKGQLGHGHMSQLREPNRVEYFKENNIVIESVSLGDRHSGAIDSDGDLYTWGGNDNGQLGLGNNLSISVPSFVSSFQGVDIASLSLGSYYSAAIDSNGNFWSWGNNSNGQLGSGDYEDINVPSIISFPNDILYLSSGESHTLAIDSESQLWMWGGNDFGQLGHSVDNFIRVNYPLETIITPIIGELDISQSSEDRIFLTDFRNGDRQYLYEGMRIVSEGSNPLVSNVITDMSAGAKTFTFDNLSSGTFILEITYDISSNNWIKMASVSAVIDEFGPIFGSLEKDLLNENVINLSYFANGNLEHEITALRIVNVRFPNFRSQSILDMNSGEKQFVFDQDVLGTYQLEALYADNSNEWAVVYQVPPIVLDVREAEFGDLNYYGGDIISLNYFVNGLSTGSVEKMRIINTEDAQVRSAEVTDISEGPKNFYFFDLVRGSYALQASYKTNPGTWEFVDSVDNILISSQSPVIGELSYDSGENFVNLSYFKNGNLGLEISELRLVSESDSTMASNIVTDMTTGPKRFSFINLVEGTYKLQYKLVDDPVNAPWQDITSVSDITITFGITVGFIVFIIVGWLVFLGLVWLLGYFIVKYRNRDSSVKVRKRDFTIEIMADDFVVDVAKAKSSLFSKKVKSDDSTDDFFGLNEF